MKLERGERQRAEFVATTEESREDTNVARYAVGE
jgi:hypothetical protein